MQQPANPAANPAVAEWRMYIDGALVESASGQVFSNIDPFTEEVIGVTADGTADDFRRAIAAARRAFDTTSWSTDHAFRAHCLTQLHDALERHKEEIRALLVSEIGTSVWLTRDTLLDVPIARLEDYAKLAVDYPYEKELPELDFRGTASRRFQRREPMGVVAAITPWNGPWGDNLTKVGCGLASGNTVLLKPSPDAPWAGTILGRIAAEETDLPPGVLNVVTSSDNLMGEILTTDPRVDLIAFTGSAPNGRRIAEVSAKTLKRLILELGGKSPYVVLESADAVKQAEIAAKLICTNAGQGCVARSRLLLPRARYEEGVQAAAAVMAQVTYGDPRNPHNYMGPVVSRQHRDRILGHIDRAIAEGNRLVCGGRIPPQFNKGYFVEPTLFADVKPDDSIAQDEVFGPVLAVIPYDDEEEALAIANNSIYGLSATVVAATDDEAIHFASRLRTGTVSVNGGVWMHMDVPFGGYKHSGIGRQFGIEGFESYLETKIIAVPSGKPSRTLAWGEV
jgi:aldehyde dehydrogenase (NAD+)